jgi:hypothetical protein
MSIPWRVLGVLCMLAMFPSMAPGGENASHPPNSPKATQPEVIIPRIDLSSVFPNRPVSRETMDKGVLGKDSPWFWDDPAGRRGAKPSLQPLPDGFATHNGPASPLVGGYKHHWLAY